MTPGEVSFILEATVSKTFWKQEKFAAGRGAPMGEVRLRDIAERLGVSVTTVSRALAGYNDVAPKTRQLVLRTAREMGYYPNLTARQLQRRRTDTIGLVVDVTGPRFSDPLFSELLAGVGNRAAREGFDLFVATMLPDTDDELQAYRRLVRGRRVDGIIVVRTRVADRRVQFLLEQQFPFITFGRSTITDHVSWVDVDGERGVQMVVERLIAAGHRHIAMLQPDLPLMFALLRERGYRRAMRAHGLPVKETWIVRRPLTEDGGYQGMQHLLRLRTPPTAVVAGNDQMAIGAIRALQDRGLRAGSDVAVVGFDDIPLARHVHPSLTTLRQPIYEIGQHLCRLLVAVLRREADGPRHLLLQPELIVRESARL